MHTSFYLEQRSPVYRSRLQFLEPHVTHALHQVHKFKQAKHINILLSKRGSQKCFARQCTAPNNGSKSDKTEKKDEKEPFTCQTNNSGIKRNKKWEKFFLFNKYSNSYNFCKTFLFTSFNKQDVWRPDIWMCLSGNHFGLTPVVSNVLWKYSGGNTYLMPCSICQLVHSQRNEQCLFFIVVLVLYNRIWSSIKTSYLVEKPLLVSRAVRCFLSLVTRFGHISGGILYPFVQKRSESFRFLGCNSEVAWSSRQRASDGNFLFLKFLNNNLPHGHTADLWGAWILVIL